MKKPHTELWKLTILVEIINSDGNSIQLKAEMF